MVIGLTLNSNCRDNSFNEALTFNKVDGKNLRYTQSFVAILLEDNYQFYSSPE
jgi:hypothetical protein